MDQITTLLTEAGLLFSDFFDPRKRVFLGYLALSFVIGLIWLLIARRASLRSAIQEVFSKDVFWSPSSRADYKVFILNRIITLGLSPMLLTKLAVATAVFYGLHGIDGLSRNVLSGVSDLTAIVLFTLTIFVVDDFTKYWLHRWMHRWPLLWAIHKVHHSAETLTPITVYRVHPLEGVLYGLRGAVAQGSTLALFLFLFGDSVDIYTVMGANVLSFVFHVTGSNLRHSHVNIHYWPWLEHLLISPAQHQVHHSVATEHYDRNFGVAFAVWDWIFGSLHLSEPHRRLKFGLGPGQGNPSSLRNLYLGPFVDMAKVIRLRWRRLRNWASGSRLAPNTGEQ